MKYYLVANICRKCKLAKKYNISKKNRDYCSSWDEFASNWNFIKVEVPENCALILEYVFNEKLNEELPKLEIEF